MPLRSSLLIIKKESPNEGTETIFVYPFVPFFLTVIKKESPNEGTETFSIFHDCLPPHIIKKESPNEGTETGNDAVDILIIDGHKKRIPE